MVKEIKDVANMIKNTEGKDLSGAAQREASKLVQREAISLGNEFNIIKKTSRELLKFSNGETILTLILSIQNYLSNMIYNLDTFVKRSTENRLITQFMKKLMQEPDYMQMYGDTAMVIMQAGQLNDELKRAWDQDDKYIDMLFNNEDKVRPSEVKVNILDPEQTNRLDQNAGGGAWNWVKEQVGY